ncbi:Vacuolar protein sorting-associated protein 9A-like protein [Drosera capensis]
MENNSADALSTSTAPLTWHDFLERMRQPSAAEFVKAIKSFIVSFSNNAPDPEKDTAAVQQFLANMEAAFRAHPLWAGCSEEELESAGEGLEKYVMTKLFTRCFASLPDDVKADEQLSEKMAMVQQFIRPEHLDIQPTFQNETSWLLAQKELQKINMHKSPREKLVCILSCCKVITNLLVNASIATNENPPGADVFIPVLIYVTIKANPPQLHSNLLYIQRYRRQTRLVAEADYFFTGMLSAESFISNINAESLSMEESEFEGNMESARALISGLSSYFENNTSTTVPQDYGQQVSTPKVKALEDQVSIKKNLSVSDLEDKGAKMLLKEEQNVFQEFPYVFANVGDLTLNDVEDLLNNYKQLVLKYVCLSKGMGLGVAPDSHLPRATQAETQSQTENDRRSEEDTIIGDINAHESHDRVEDGLNELSHLESDSSESKQEEGGTATVVSEEESSEATSLPSQKQLDVVQ